MVYWHYFCPCVSKHGFLVASLACTCAGRVGSVPEWGQMFSAPEVMSSLTQSLPSLSGQLEAAWPKAGEQLLFLLHHALCLRWHTQGLVFLCQSQRKAGGKCCSGRRVLSGYWQAVNSTLSLVKMLLWINVTLQNKCIIPWCRWSALFCFLQQLTAVWSVTT